MAQINELIHQPVRLRIMSALNMLETDERVDFSTLRELLDVTDGNLATHLRRLEDAGYVQVEKTFVGRRPRTYIGITPAGRLAFEEHVRALQEILKA